MTARVPRNSRAPFAIVVDADQPTSERSSSLRWDPAEVASGVLEVVFPDGSTATWSATVIETRTYGVTLLHRLDLLGAETSQLGQYQVRPVLTFNDAGVLRGAMQFFQVTA